MEQYSGFAGQPDTSAANSGHVVFFGAGVKLMGQVPILGPQIFCVELDASCLDCHAHTPFCLAVQLAGQRPDAAGAPPVAIGFPDFAEPGLYALDTGVKK